MKIVLFGPERRIGALEWQQVIDLNRALAGLQTASLRRDKMIATNWR